MKLIDIVLSSSVLSDEQKREYVRNQNRLNERLKRVQANSQKRILQLSKMEIK